MHIYSVTIHERDYVGSVNELRISRLAIKAKTMAEAESKAVKWNYKKGHSACRVTDITELDNDYDDLIK